MKFLLFFLDISDSRTGHLLHVEWKPLKDLTKDGEKVNFKPAEALGNLHTLCQGLKKRITDEGDYLIKHDTSSENFVKILKAVSNDENNGVGAGGKRLFDLHQHYENCDPKSDAPIQFQFKTLDTETLTPWHYQFGRVPCMFQPCADNTYLNYQKTPGKRGGRGRKNKK